MLYRCGNEQVLCEKAISEVVNAFFLFGEPVRVNKIFEGIGQFFSGLVYMYY